MGLNFANDSESIFDRIQFSISIGRQIEQARKLQVFALFIYYSADADLPF